MAGNVNHADDDDQNEDDKDDDGKGRVPLPNRMNFWGKFQRRWGHFQSKNLCCRFWELETRLFEHEIDTKKV